METANKRNFNFLDQSQKRKKQWFDLPFYIVVAVVLELKRKEKERCATREL